MPRQSENSPVEQMHTEPVHCCEKRYIFFLSSDELLNIFSSSRQFSCQECVAPFQNSSYVYVVP